ncbi:MAG: outer membrane beta-barrel protein [Bacteroidales bacterium]|jgi:hypothetical protein|nr:outer membrane beta-barrel protein [Bacteroidales bacterium]
MKKKFLKVMCAAAVFLATAMTANAQVPISFSGQVGYASPQGSFFKTAAGEKMSKFGLNFDFDVLYHLDQFDNKLGVGITYDASVLFGADLNNFSKIGLYGLSHYAVKGQWRFFNSKVSPYGSLSLGLNQFSTPEVSVNGEVVAESENAFGFGIRPEIGVDLSGFLISVGYVVPMKYSVENVKKSASCWQISIGGRISLFDR